MSNNVIYGLIDPNTKELRYVGYTNNLKRRFAHHIIPSSLNKKNHKNDWIKSLLKHNYKPEIIILETYDDFKDLPQAEIDMIAYCKYIGCNLTNGTSGGDGGSTRSGMKASEFFKKRMSEVHKGKILSNETRLKISQTNPSIEHRKKLSDSHLITNQLIKKCLLCKSDTHEILSLGETPLANAFVDNPINQDFFPLTLIQCNSCNHVSLNYIINKKTLFSNYLYVSGTSPVNVKHFKDYADKIIKKFSLTELDTVCDIASNDGCFLQNFKNHGIKIIGVDPAQNIAAQANINGIFTIPEFFDAKLANNMVKKYGKLKVITCNNMLAHNKGIKEIVKGIKRLLHKNGSFIFENSYLLDICDKTLIDLVYHEHIHHFHITPLVKFFNKLKMDIYEVERLPNHGGSIRVYVCLKGKKQIDKSVQECLDVEKTINDKLLLLDNKVQHLKKTLNSRLKELYNQGKSIFIYAYPAKATTLFYAFDLDPNMFEFVIEDAALKIGKYTPGNNIPIYGPEKLKETNCDIGLILGWNFAESIKANNSNFKGTWITPLPEYEEDVRV
jgi:SAM-dependent methyltransferase